MCRNIKVLYNSDPPATKGEINDASLQFVRKISGYTQPSTVNQKAFQRAVRQVAAASASLLDSLSTNFPPKDRAKEAANARARSVKRYGTA